MNEKDAINVLTQAVLIGQKNGIYSLQDSSLIFQALTILNPDFNKHDQPAEKEQREETPKTE